ncbi:S-adenosyl-L-methionine-dependent methyltransferase [Bisporella sp. PMI_857]|nr:S-adenosyl-L-methionine-dependent methyltransferase [Bisporella sp. PMI_857]
MSPAQIYGVPARTTRLNFQHQLAVSVTNGCLLHPAIPVSDVKNVADVGTGTGIWLEDLYTRQLRSEVISEDRCFDGYDISPAHFPKKGNCNHIVHDVLKPFPTQYHGYYDLVHVRYMALSLKTKEYSLAADNLMDLLKPGGYIQWEDFDYADISANPGSSVHEELITIISTFLRGRGMSTRSSHDVVAALKAAGFENVTREERNSYWESGLTHEVRKWAWTSIQRLTLRALIWSGLARDKDAAGIITRDMLRRLEDDYMGGVVPNFPHRIILGKKSVCDV